MKAPSRHGCAAVGNPRGVLSMTVRWASCPAWLWSATEWLWFVFVGRG